MIDIIVNLHKISIKLILYLKKMESAFEEGYDTEEEIGPSWVATHLEPSVSRGNTTGHSPSWKRH